MTDPETYCTSCSTLVTTDANGVDHGHQEWCEKLKE